MGQQHTLTMSMGMAKPTPEKAPRCDGSRIALFTPMSFPLLFRSTPPCNEQAVLHLEQMDRQVADAELYQPSTQAVQSLEELWMQDWGCRRCVKMAFQESEFASVIQTQICKAVPYTRRILVSGVSNTEKHVA